MRTFWLLWDNESYTHFTLHVLFILSFRQQERKHIIFLLQRISKFLSHSSSHFSDMSAKKRVHTYSHEYHTREQEKKLKVNFLNKLSQALTCVWYFWAQNLSMASFKTGIKTCSHSFKFIYEFCSKCKRLVFFDSENFFLLSLHNSSSPFNFYSLTTHTSWHSGLPFHLMFVCLLTHSLLLTVWVGGVERKWKHILERLEM